MYCLIGITRRCSEVVYSQYWTSVKEATCRDYGVPIGIVRRIVNKIASLSVELVWSSRLRAKRQVSSDFAEVAQSAKTHSRSSGTSLRGYRGRWHNVGVPTDLMSISSRESGKFLIPIELWLSPKGQSKRQKREDDSTHI